MLGRRALTLLTLALTLHQCAGLCSNTCFASDDGMCDDGGPDAWFDSCDLGTDCADCGECAIGTRAGCTL